MMTWHYVIVVLNNYMDDRFHGNSVMAHEI